MTKTLRIAIAGGIIACAVATTGSISAWTGGGHRSFVTFNQAVSLPNTELRAGTYIFELANPNVNPDLVRVTSRDHKKVYMTAFTRIVDRPAGLPADMIVKIGEAPRDGAAPVTVWYPSPSGSGFEFIYR